MKTGPDISRIAALIGDPARANILTALMSGKALTATELAGEAGVTPQTASAHLSKLEAGGLVSLRRAGRHKYVSLASEDVAHLLETLMGLAAGSGHLARGYLQRNDDALLLTDTGHAFIANLGLDLAALPSPRTPMCRDCLDWSERRAHLAGRLGRGLLSHIEGLGWARRVPDTRIVRFTPPGEAAFDRAFPSL
jgi:DNA-binding transcriptional ArsR family regulator